MNASLYSTERSLTSHAPRGAKRQDALRKQGWGTRLRTGCGHFVHRANATIAWGDQGKTHAWQHLYALVVEPGNPRDLTRSMRDLTRSMRYKPYRGFSGGGDTVGCKAALAATRAGRGGKSGRLRRLSTDFSHHRAALRVDSAVTETSRISAVGSACSCEPYPPARHLRARARPTATSPMRPTKPKTPSSPIRS